ncbi:Gfo/Idh/MocA family protein [Rufibacter psychrotolerans]|uniref:Gfo/Idh/MocA family protein n=1 Tax=Rufibacter psychrotolerans TaxID=2812556 RepID=UPI0019688421|nr:Gfo/Idh/MocA family oxidoreductase [Rufibacter sp. SYSU D00308]
MQANRRDFVKSITLAGLGLGLGLSALPTWAQVGKPEKGKRVGIIGLDSSHSLAFTKVLNAPNAGPEFGGYRVVAAYPYGSKELELSIKRIPQYIEEIKKYEVAVVDSIQKLLKQVDVVLLETNDGRLHLEQALPVLKARKMLFIDKPIAASLADAQEIYKAAEQYGTPVFSSSSLRFMANVQEVASGKHGAVTGAETYSPATLEKTHPDLYWYGIHGVETLFAVMGPGCERVVRHYTPETDVVIGTWKDGRIGTFRGLRTGKQDFGGTCFTQKGIIQLGPYTGYNPLLKEIVTFFQTGKAPVAPKETLEILAFMDAADESKKQNGSPVTLAEMFERARS